MFEVAPNIFDDFFLFDDNNWMLLYRYRRFLAKDVCGARDKLADVLTAYLKLPKERRQEETWFMKTWERALRDLVYCNGIGMRHFG